MKTVLFCGGQGMRIREYSEAVPKPMIPIGQQPILWHLTSYYAGHGHKVFVLPDYPDRSVAFGRTAAIVLRGCGEIVTATPARRARFFGSSKRRL